MRSWLVRWHRNCSQAKSDLSALDLPSPTGNCRTVWVRYKGRLWKVQRDLLNTSDHKNTWKKAKKVPETGQEGPVVRSSLSYSYDLLSSPKWSVQSLSAARHTNGIWGGSSWGSGREGSTGDGTASSGSGACRALSRKHRTLFSPLLSLGKNKPRLTKGSTKY